MLTKYPLRLFPPGTNTSEIPDDDPRLTALDPPLDMQVKKKAREVFVEEELLKRRYVLQLLDAAPILAQI